jgi:hypothetical protein
MNLWRHFVRVIPRPTDSSLLTIHGFAPFPPFSDERNEGRQARRRMPPARVIEKRPRKAQAPIIEHGDELPGPDRVQRVALSLSGPVSRLSG